MTPKRETIRSNRPASEAVDLRIGLHQRDIAEPAFGKALAGAGQHRLGYVYSYHPTARTHGHGKGYRGRTGAATDLQNAFV